MPNQIVLSWDVDVSGTPYGPAAAAAALGAVPLYRSDAYDPVLGQFLGLSVADDAVTTPDATTARRTLTLNMFSADDETPAPAPFQCHPRSSTADEVAEPPYLLRRSVTLPGSAFVQNGLAVAPTSETLEPSLSIGDQIQFLSQIGVFYEITAISSSAIGFTPVYTGVSGNTTATKEVPAPVTRLAIYSTSDLDTSGLSAPDIPAGPGAQSVIFEYTDSQGASEGVVVELTGRRPVVIELAPGTIDVAQIDVLILEDVGAFGNSVGQITVCTLSADLPVIRPNATLAQWNDLVDEAQLLIDGHLAYLPPSYFALAQQGAATPSLEGDFFVTTGSRRVPCSQNQTLELAAGYLIEFASQPGVLYEIETLSNKALALTTPYTGIDTNHAGLEGDPNINAGTQGNLGTSVTNERTDARLVSPPPGVPPSVAALATPMAEFVDPATASPPPNPPQAPSTVPTPTFLSGIFTRQIRLALKGARVTANEITFV